jgi:hypothetical protein
MGVGMGRVMYLIDKDMSSRIRCIGTRALDRTVMVLRWEVFPS